MSKFKADAVHKDKSKAPKKGKKAVATKKPAKLTSKEREIAYKARGFKTC